MTLEDRVVFSDKSKTTFFPPAKYQETFYSTSIPKDAIIFPEMIPVDVNGSYTISTKVKNDLEKPTLFYLGLVCYDEKGQPITDRMVNRRSNPLTIISIDVTRKIIFTEGNDWTHLKDAIEKGPYYATDLGFYFDGNTEKLPDTILETNTNNLGCIEKIETNRIYLRDPLPQHIVQKISLGISKCENHFASGTYKYLFCGNISKADGIKELKYTIHGESMNDEGVKFRLTTKSVKIVLLCNYNYTQGDELQTLFQNVKFERID